MKADLTDISNINRAYAGRFCVYGDLHNHAATGGRSDGKCSLSEWQEGLEALDMDFAAILDHRQVRHMYLPEWDDSIFVSGTEPCTEISDSNAKVKYIHYNMLFENKSQLEELLNEFPEYSFEGGSEGFFEYPAFTKDRFKEVIRSVKSKGGFLVHPHPKQLMETDDPLEYWFSDETGIEVFYRDFRNSWTEDNYALWCDLLRLGKRVWACAGEDGHDCCKDTALTAVYVTEKHCPSYIKYFRTGDFVCGGVGIKMCIGDTRMGGACDFENKRLVAYVGDLHKSIKNTEHQYEVVLLSDTGVVFTSEISPSEDNYFAFDTENVKFYRLEVFDKTLGVRIAIGNPIWNLK